MIGSAQKLYSRSFGRPGDQAVIFMHGGPGSSTVYFEATTAQLLANRGFFVIVYDRRGEGRSADANARMNYEEAFTDLKSIYAHYHLQKASLLAFSFGGLIAAQFADSYPQLVSHLVLCSALVSQQKSYDTILRSAKAIYQQNGEKVQWHELARIAALDTNSLEYRTEVFKHASANGFFTLGDPSPRAKAIYQSYATDTLIARYVKNTNAVATFWQNEPAHNIDVTPRLKALHARSIPIYGMYGKQDGLYSPGQIAALRQLLGHDSIQYVDHCAHTVFIDQQDIFLNTVSAWLRQ